jgi:hypothetical protein
MCRRGVVGVSLAVPGWPLWEEAVFEVLQWSYEALHAIFRHYARSLGGSVTAEDAVEMTMTELKHLVKDVGLEVCAHENSAHHGAMWSEPPVRPWKSPWKSVCIACHHTSDALTP